MQWTRLYASRVLYCCPRGRSFRLYKYSDRNMPNLWRARRDIEGITLKLIKFRRLSTKPKLKHLKVRMGGYPPLGIPTRVFHRLVEIDPWEIAFNEEDLFAKLDGEMAEIIMPDKHILARLWGRLFPPKAQECQLGIWNELNEGE